MLLRPCTYFNVGSASLTVCEFAVTYYIAKTHNRTDIQEAARLCVAP